MMLGRVFDPGTPACSSRWCAAPTAPPRPCASSCRPPGSEGYSLDLMQRDRRAPERVVATSPCARPSSTCAAAVLDGLQPQLRRPPLDAGRGEGRRLGPTGRALVPQAALQLRPDRVAVAVQRQVRAGVAPALRRLRHRRAPRAGGDGHPAGRIRLGDPGPREAAGGRRREADGGRPSSDTEAFIATSFGQWDDTAGTERDDAAPDGARHRARHQARHRARHRGSPPGSPPASSPDSPPASAPTRWSRERRARRPEPAGPTGGSASGRGQPDGVGERDDRGLQHRAAELLEACRSTLARSSARRLRTGYRPADQWSPHLTPEGPPGRGATAVGQQSPAGQSPSGPPSPRLRPTNRGSDGTAGKALGRREQDQRLQPSSPAVVRAATWPSPVLAQGRAGLPQALHGIVTGRRPPIGAEQGPTGTVGGGDDPVQPWKQGRAALRPPAPAAAMPPPPRPGEPTGSTRARRRTRHREWPLHHRRVEVEEVAVTTGAVTAPRGCASGAGSPSRSRAGRCHEAPRCSGGQSRSACSGSKACHAPGLRSLRGHSPRSTPPGAPRSGGGRFGRTGSADADADVGGSASGQQTHQSDQRQRDQDHDDRHLRGRVGPDTSTTRPSPSTAHWRPFRWKARNRATGPSVSHAGRRPGGTGPAPTSCRRPTPPGRRWRPRS